MSVENPERFVGNPVNAFLIVKQLTKNLQSFIDTLNNFEHLKSKKTFKSVIVFLTDA